MDMSAHQDIYSWFTSPLYTGSYFAEISIFAHNRSGIILDVSRVMTENGINMTSVNSRVAKSGMSTTMIGFEIKSTDQLLTLIGKLRQIEGVVDVERTMG